MSKFNVRHQATITSIDSAKGTITAQISVTEACQSCAARKACSGEAQKEFTLLNDFQNRKIGDNITLCITKSMTITAVVVAYMLPVIIVVTALLVMQNAGVQELKAGVIALGTIVAYFITLRLFRQKLEKQITITIE